MDNNQFYEIVHKIQKIQNQLHMSNIKFDVDVLHTLAVNQKEHNNIMNLLDSGVEIIALECDKKKGALKIVRPGFFQKKKTNPPITWGVIIEVYCSVETLYEVIFINNENEATKIYEQLQKLEYKNDPYIRQESIKTQFTIYDNLFYNSHLRTRDYNALTKMKILKQDDRPVQYNVNVLNIKQIPKVFWCQYPDSFFN